MEKTNWGEKYFLKVGRISPKDEILIVQENRIAQSGKKKKISLEMTPCKREV